MKPSESIYPAPLVPISPVLSSASLRLFGRKQCPPGILQHSQPVNLTSGRAAIALALEHAGIEPGDEILVPAYHCESMISPIRWKGATPIFYRVGKDTAVDLQSLSHCLTRKTRAILVTHYFGFPQAMSMICEFARQNDLIVIEDCAHAFFGERNGSSVGSSGDYAIASSMKFFPVFDGGILISNSSSLSEIALERSPLSFQLKSIINIFEVSAGYERLGVIGKLIQGVGRIKDWIWSGVKSRKADSLGGIDAPQASGGGSSFDERWIKKSNSWAGKTLLRYSDFERVVRKRRRNYGVILEALRGIPGIRPVHATLPEGVVPLVFPLYVESSDSLFPILKSEGVPIWRFGEFLDPSIDKSVCENSIDLSDHIFQFPCHQELKEAELDWIISRIKHGVVSLKER